MRGFLGVTLVVVTMSFPAIAEDAFEAYHPGGQEIDVSYGASQMRLAANGYRGVNMVGNNPLRLSAYDPQGSEVLLWISPISGDVTKTSHVYSMDR